MKKLICIVSALILMAFSCRKEPEQMTVLRDCTGVYLRLDNKDYHVCNPEKVSSFPDGAVVTASFKRVNECNGSAKTLLFV
jgi:hypothetical protein